MDEHDGDVVVPETPVVEEEVTASEPVELVESEVEASEEVAPEVEPEIV